ncbi:MAG: glycosyltransferase family 87 protein [Cyanobacteria bacterium P01_C01_bin.69]
MESPTPPSHSHAEQPAIVNSVLNTLWSRHGQRLLQLGIGLMIAAMAWRLGLEVPRLLWGQQEFDAIDLINRHTEVHRWFAKLPVYGAMDNGDYPPASHTMLWPFMGWLDLATTRWVWMFSTLAMLGWLGWLGMRESLATTPWEKVFIALMPFALYPASATINVGQLAIHVMPPLVMGLLLMARRRANGHDTDSSLGRDVVAAIFVIFAFVKPTLSVPFFWIACFVPGRWRPVLLVSFGYLLLAAIATLFQGGNLLSLHFAWLDQAGTQLGTRGHANVHVWLEAMGLSSWMLPASFVLLVATGVWTLRYRRLDPWILLGVAALISRFWTDHRMFDDLLIWVPMIALFRLAKVLPFGQATQLMATLLFTLNWFVLMAPARFLAQPLLLSSPLEIAIKVGHALIWLSSLVFFMALPHTDIYRDIDKNSRNSKIAAKESV